VRGSEQQTKTGIRGVLRRLFRQAVKALLDPDEPSPAARKRSGETRGAFGLLARKLIVRSLARRAFGAARAILSPGRPAVFLGQAFGPPDPCNPFDPVWQQPYIEDHAGYEEHFADDQPPADYPSANL
jgi:hypothetical protein